TPLYVGGVTALTVTPPAWLIATPTSSSRSWLLSTVCCQVNDVPIPAVHIEALVSATTCGVGVAVAVFVGVNVAVFVGVRVGVGVLVAVNVAVLVGVFVAVFVGVNVGV